MKDAQRTGRLMYIAEAAFEYFVAILVGGAYLARITGALGFSTSLTGILSSFVSLGCVFQLSSIALFRRAVSVKRPVIALEHDKSGALRALLPDARAAGERVHTHADFPALLLLGSHTAQRGRAAEDRLADGPDRRPPARLVHGEEGNRVADGRHGVHLRGRTGDRQPGGGESGRADLSSGRGAHCGADVASGWPASAGCPSGAQRRGRRAA